MRYLPQKMKLQWHITDKCNLFCKHCYQNSKPDSDLSFDKLVLLLNQYDDLLRTMNCSNKTHINITGGEPFAREDFFEILSLLYEKNSKYSYGILTNGTLLNEKTVIRLAQLYPAFVQISIDGKKQTHDLIRGAGSYEAACNGIKLLVKYNIPVTISFTANNLNFKEFPSVARLGTKLKVNSVWADRFIPIGRASYNDDMVLTYKNTDTLFYLMRREQNVANSNIFSKTKILMNRSLQFQYQYGTKCIYQCQAGLSLITINTNGDLYPCRRMPVLIGNLLHDSLSDLYFSHPDMIALRPRSNENSNCSKCKFHDKCRGGLKCLSYALHGTPFADDPGCKYLYKLNKAKNTV